MVNIDEETGLEEEKRRSMEFEEGFEPDTVKEITIEEFNAKLKRWKESGI
jgi:hypothetical protein